jgi:hypothetical protein
VNLYKIAQIKTTLDTKFDVNINLSVREFFAIDKFTDKLSNYGDERIAKEALLKIIRQHAGLIRMRTEGKI